MSGHEVTPVPGRCVTSACPKPKLVKLVLSVSVWREVKFVVVGSRKGFTGFASDPWPEKEPLEDVGKNAEGVLSTYCCDVGTCAMERFRDGDTPELLACGMLPADGFSPQAGRVLGLHSVSEFATREPEPDLASPRSADAPARALLSVYVSVIKSLNTPQTVPYLEGASCPWWPS